MCENAPANQERSVVAPFVWPVQAARPFLRPGGWQIRIPVMSGNQVKMKLAAKFPKAPYLFYQLFQSA